MLAFTGHTTGHAGLPQPPCGRPPRATPPAIDIAARSAAPASRARSRRAVPLGSFAELSCQKIVSDLQLADLAVQKINLRVVGCTLGRRSAALEHARRAVQQLFLPI